MGYTAGVVISASHNPFEDNGIKVFSGAGEKFTETLEQQRRGDRRRRLVDDSRRRAPATSSRSTTDRPTSAISSRSCRRRSAARSCASSSIARNGATTTVAPRVFDELGLQTRVHRLRARWPQHQPALRIDGAGTAGADGRRRQYDLGIAYDGDGDRAIFVDARGSVVDGDAVMLMCAKQMKAEGRLKGDAIVATVMSNIGLEIALREAGIGLVRCQVGDKYVMEEMLRRGFVLGGEQSGHVIFSEYLFTGDGLATSLNVLRTMAATAASLADLASDLTTYPQVLHEPARAAEGRSEDDSRRGGRH